MKSWVKNLKVGDTLFFVSRQRRTAEGMTLPVSKIGRKYVYVKQSEYREIQIERENGRLVDADGEIYESQAEYDEDRRRSRVISAIEESMRYSGKFTKLPTPAIDAIFGIINGMVDVAALKAENERLIALNAELADLAGSTVGMLQGGGWLALADEIKEAIAKVDAPKGYARLIAAAPDLLSALKAMIDEHEPLTSSACDLQNKVRALIDKVEGGSA